MDFVFLSFTECSPYRATFDCDLSGWMGLIFGDMLIAFSLAIFWNYLSQRNNAKIDANNQAIKNNSVFIQKIIADQQKMYQRRQTYVIQSFKNHFSALLLFIGLIHNFSENLSQNKNNYLTDVFDNDTFKNKEFENMLQKSRNTLNLSIDVIDPMLVGEIEQFFILAEQNISQNIQNKKPLDYDNLKNNIMKLTKRLNEYEDEILK